MSISSFFADLGAPLANTRWSWGSQRPSDGAVFLRVWQDLKFIEHGQVFMLVAGAADDDGQRLGGQERLKHLQTVSEGSACYLVMCTAKDVEASPRAIQSFNDAEVFRGGDLRETPGDFAFPSSTAGHVRRLVARGGTWIRLGPRLPLEECQPAKRP